MSSSSNPPLQPTSSNPSTSSLPTSQPASSSLPVRPTVKTSGSFLGKLPGIRKIPGRLPFRGNQQRVALNAPLDPNAPPLGTLVVRVLAARNLVAKDRNGSSDPYAVIRYGPTRVTGPTVTKSLNPVWGGSTEGAAGEAKLETTVFESRAFGRERVEVVIWDRDRVGREYLGEISLALEQWWGESEGWSNGTPPVGIDDEGNKPIWHTLASSRSKATVSGEVLVQIGFAPIAPADSSTTVSGLTPAQRERLLQVLQRLSEEQESLRRSSKEERVLLASPTEGVNTKMIDDFSPLGSTPAQLHHLHSAVDGDETDSSSTSDDSTTTDEDTDGEETDTEGEYEDAGALTSTEDEAELVTAREAPTDYFGRGEPLTKVVSPEQFEPADLPPAVPAIIVDPHAPTPTTTSAPTLPLSTTSSTTTTRSTDAPSRPASRRSGLSLPGFMKRRDSSKSVVSVNTPDASDINSTDVDSSTAVGGDGKKQQKKKRFSRRKREVEPDDGIGAALLGAGAPVAAVGAPEMVKKGKGKKARKAAKKGDGEEEEGEEERGERKQRRREKKEKRLERRRTKRDYTFADDEDILGLVQIEIKSATDLPRFKNMLKTGYDMDAFTVISFGRKVFRTRVIRHSLNPTWNESLFFHVRKSETSWTIGFNIYDWDKISSNDHVGDVTVPLDELLGSTVKPDERGLYPAKSDGRLDGDEFKEHNLPIKVAEGDLSSAKLQIRAKFTPYSALRQQFWRVYLRNYDIDESGTFSHLEIFSMLDSLGSTLSKDTISSFFTRSGKTVEQELTADEVILCLEQEVVKPKEEKRLVDSSESSTESGTTTPAVGGSSGPTSFTPSKPADANDSTDPSSNMETIKPGTEIVTNAEQGHVVRAPGGSGSSGDAIPSRDGSNDAQSSDEGTGKGKVERVVNIRTCPLCHKPRLSSKAELDIITHLGICSSSDPRAVNRIVVAEYVTASQAQRKWITKVIGKATKGAYSLGADSANIIVQDRQTGSLQEEKMASYVRLGMRVIYRGIGTGGGIEGERVRRLLKSLTYKQGVKYDAPASVRDIEPFIEFHNLNLDEVLDPVSSFKTFNEFFYRKLKPDARPLADPNDPKTLVSPADCRAMFFQSVNEATKIWIKGREFSVARMLGDAYKDRLDEFKNSSLAIFRLAPQDYHRFHSPVDGVVGPRTKIEGQYYTVNPLAIRSQLDVYGENVRTVGSIHSETFGETVHVWVGAMLVAGTYFTVNEGDTIKRGDEVGYFAFGASTVVCLFQSIQFDEDLLENSRNSIETLVRMGSRIGRKI